jgi:tetratricopeptide (TPR) repeat protein
VKLETAIRLDPENVDYWFRLGVAREGNNNHKRALAAYERAAAIKDDVWQYWYHIGNHRMFAGNFPGALEALDKAIDLHQDFDY